MSKRNSTWDRVVPACWLALECRYICTVVNNGTSSDAGSRSPDWTRSPAREQCYIVATQYEGTPREGSSRQLRGKQFQESRVDPGTRVQQSGLLACWLQLVRSIISPDFSFKFVSVVGCQMPWGGGGGLTCLTNASAVAVSGLQEQHPRTTGQGPRAGLLKTTAVINKTVEPSVKLRFGQARRSADSFCSWFTNIKLQRRAPLSSLGDPRRPHGARNTPPHRGGQSKQGA